jgi:hypothetical protein
MDKVRLILVFMASQEGVRNADVEELIDTAGLSAEEREIIESMSAIGVTLDRVLSFMICFIIYIYLLFIFPQASTC